MSRKTTPNKKNRRRLDNTRSRASSGISTMSNISRSADNIFDTDDMNFQTSNGEAHCSPDGLKYAVLPHIKSGSQPASTVNRGQRRVSWNVCNEDEETFLKKFNNQSNVPYDNRNTQRNLPLHNSYTRNSPRTVDIPCHYNSSPHRPIRNNTSQEELRRKYKEQELMIELLLQKDRVNNTKRKQQRFASVTSLRGTPTINVPTLDANENGNMYESISQGSQFNRPFQRNNIPNRFVFTPPAMHPTKFSKRRSRSCDFLNDEEHEDLIGPPNKIIERPQALGRTSNLDVLEARPDDNITEREINPNNKCSNSCSYRLFLKLFYTLLVVNTIIVLMNISLIPILYVATYGHNKEDFVCMECGTLRNNEVDVSGLQNLEDGKCCVTSSRELLAFINATHLRSGQLIQALPSSSNTSHSEETAIAQYIARKEVFIVNNTRRISWAKELEPVQKTFEPLEASSNETIIQIPVSGFYYIFSRIHYRKSYADEGGYFKVGHSIVKMGHDTVLDSTEETCFARESPAITRHTSSMGTIQKFTQGDQIYIRLDHEQYFEYGHTKIGLFLIRYQ